MWCKALFADRLQINPRPPGYEGYRVLIDGKEIFDSRKDGWARPIPLVFLKDFESKLMIHVIDGCLEINEDPSLFPFDLNEMVDTFDVPQEDVERFRRGETLHYGLFSRNKEEMLKGKMFPKKRQELSRWL